MSTPNPVSPETGGVYLEPGRVALLTSACDEIEQLTRVLGTLGNSIDSELVRRSVAVRVHDLNRVVQGVLTESEVNPVDMKKAGVTVYGPAWWGGSMSTTPSMPGSKAEGLMTAAVQEATKAARQPDKPPRNRATGQAGGE